ncbi:hypothetical protein BJX63DRAFT_108968 [Aspergillus granulosus]|uniref:Acetamidase n=1 Tax=Aspergillus granulosus TaxID=176169 RepID=A0ABR4HRD8_9EURO
MDKSEILVHISGPSGAGDDARYRAQVEAILNFQSHSRELITFGAGETQSHLTSSPPPSGTSPRPNTNGSVNSPPRIPIQVAKRPASPNDSLGSPVSVIPDSQPQQSEFIAESRYLSSSSFPSKRPRVDSPSSSFNHFQPDEVQHLDPAGNHDPATDASTIINTQSTTNVTTQGEQENEAEPAHPPEKQEQKQWVDLPSLPLEIKPPPPPISQSPFTTHITPTLEMLTDRLKSLRTYNPTHQARDLHDLERGYWYLRINITSLNSEKPSPVATSPGPSTWDTPLFLKFWTFLSDFIAKEGRAGWGVWCIAEDESTTTSRTTGSPDTHEVEEGPGPPLPHSGTTPGNAQQLAVKVYAWGEIVSHIYLLLFLASERRVRKMGAQWRDARDEVVIQMP